MAKMTITWKSRTREAKKEIMIGALDALRDVTGDIQREAVRNHPYNDQTGNNTRSIAFQCGKTSGPLTLAENQSAVFSTSGYGGYIETGTRWNLFTRKPMPAKPYIYPAMVKFFTAANIAKGVNRSLQRRGL